MISAGLRETDIIAHSSSLIGPPHGIVLLSYRIQFDVAHKSDCFEFDLPWMSSRIGCTSREVRKAHRDPSYHLGRRSHGQWETALAIKDIRNRQQVGKGIVCVHLYELEKDKELRTFCLTGSQSRHRSDVQSTQQQVYSGIRDVATQDFYICDIINWGSFES